MSLHVQNIVKDELCSLLGISTSKLETRATFISLGGHSLSAIKLSKLCKQKGVLLNIDKIIRSNPLSEMIESARLLDTPLVPDPQNCVEEGMIEQLETLGIDFRADLCQERFLVNGPDDKRTPEMGFEQSGNTDVVAPPTELQLSLMYGSLKSPGTNIIQHFETYRPDHIPAIKNAWRQVYEQEPILSTRYSTSLLPQRRSLFDWSELSTNDPAHFDQIVQQSPSSTAVGCSWRVVTLTETTANRDAVKSVVIWNIHHALIDGFSAELILKKIRKAVAGEPIFPGPSFADLSKRLQVLRGERKAEGDDFWERRRSSLEKAASTLQLSSPLDGGEGCAEHTFNTGHTTGELNLIAEQCNVTQATIFHAAWSIVMSIFADSNEVVFGAVIAGHSLPLSGIEDTIGPFVNTLPLMVSLDPSMKLIGLAHAVHQGMADLVQFQWTTPENGFSRQFTSAIAMQFGLDLLDHQCCIRPIERPHTRQMTEIPLSISIDQDQICLQYFKKCFKADDVELLGNLYRRAIIAFMNPDTTVAAFRNESMASQSLQTLLKNSNCHAPTTSASSIQDDLVTLFERTAQMWPDAIAVVKGAEQVTYHDLDEASSRVAKTLSQYVQHGDVVCVDADRSINWIVAIFGVLKAGAVYCALDTVVPLDHRVLLFEKSGAEIFLAPDSSGINRAPATSKMNLVCSSILSGVVDSSAIQFPRRFIPTPSSTAYICFTSGSTGTPKGVVCTHQGLVAFQTDLEVRLFARPGIKVSQLMAVAFDGSIHETFSALCHGAALVLPEEAESLYETLKLVDSAILTPSIAEVLEPDEFPDLKNVYLVGEPVKQSVVDRWGESKNLYNMYGPTEGTCGATIKKLLPGRAVTIGPPNPSTRVYILNARRELVHPGMVGEIYVAGVQVARGYLGLPEITAERFVPDSICPERGEYMYSTGDLGYWTADGEVACLGRNDRQIKLRGFRLDLNDLEIRIARVLPSIKAVAVTLKEDFLIAAIQPSSLDAELVTSLIANVLPVYARPSRLIFVNRFPMTAAGKLDFKAIASDDFMNPSDLQTQLRTPTEVKVATIWRQLLMTDHKENIGPKSGFIELGGNSLLQMKLLARLSSIFLMKIPLKVIIENHSLENLSSELDSLRTNHNISAGRSHTLGRQKLSPVEHEWWEKYRLDHATSAFNVSFVGVFQPRALDRRALADAWDTVMSRYCLFRSRYVPCRKTRVRRNYTEHAPQVQRVKAVDVWTEVNRPFDLERDAPIRVCISETTLTVTLSHIVADLTTLNILLQEVKSVYNGRTLDLVTKKYEDSIVWEEAPLCDLKWWVTYLESLPGTPSNRQAISERQSYRGTSKLFELPRVLSRAMLSFAPANNVSLQQMAIAMVALALEAQSDETDIVLGTPFINRSTEADMETVGLFLEPLPVRIRYKNNMEDVDSTPFLHHIRESSKAALSHAVPWNKLLEKLGITCDYPNNPLFETMVTFHDYSNAPRLDIPGFSTCLTWAEGSKFTLMAEFTALEKGQVMLRMEYDNEHYSAAAITRVVTSITQALTAIVADVPYHEMKKRLMERGNAEPVAVERSNLFGIQVGQI